jgi:hypothetical protein
MAHSKPSAPPAPDAELIALCEQHIANVQAYNSDGGTGQSIGGDDDPLWHACQRTEAAIDALPAQTLAGVVAKARLAKAAALADAPDGAVEMWGGAAGSWAQDVVNDLIRITAGEPA